MDLLHEELNHIVPKWTYEDIESESGDNDVDKGDNKEDQVEHI